MLGHSVLNGIRISPQGSGNLVKDEGDGKTVRYRMMDVGRTSGDEAF